MYVSNIYTQKNKGYFDSKFYVDAVALINSPLFYNLKTNGFDFSRHDKLNVGYRISGGINLSNRASFALEIGHDFGSIMNVSEEYNYTDDNGYINSKFYNYDKIDVSSFAILPKFEFSSKNGIIPIGITHQVGVGICNTRINIRKQYQYEYIETIDSYNWYTTQNYITGNSKFENNHKSKVITLLYCLNMRSSISKNIFLNYGFRYTLNFSSERFLNGLLNSSDESIDQRIYKYKNLNLITFNLGLTYIFCK